MDMVLNQLFHSFWIPSFAYLCVYTLAALMKFWLPPSYSMTFYYWERKRKGMGALFNFFCFTVGIGAGACMIQIAEGEWFQFLGFMAMAGLGLVGAAPYFLQSESSQRQAHYTGAAICAVAASLWMIFMGNWLIFACGVAASGVATLATGKSKWMFWFELALFYSAYAVIYIHLH